MSVRGRPVDPKTMLSAIDLEAKAAMGEARVVVDGIVQRDTPKRTGRLAQALKPRVTRTKTGYSLTVKPPRGARHGDVTVAQVAKWVQTGTGLYREGPGPKHKVRAKNPLRRMTLPGGRRVWSVKGQHPDPFMARIERDATPRVQELADRGAERAARAAERVVS